MKYLWRVQPKPTGPYASFQDRGWPEAYTGETVIAMIHCVDDYSPRRVKAGNHGTLRISVRCARQPTKEEPCKWCWRKLKGEFVMLGEAKIAFAEFVKSTPEHDFALDD